MTPFTEEQLREISQNRNAWLSWPEVQSLARQCLNLMDAKANREHLLNDALEALKELEEQKRVLQEENEALANKDETGTLVTNYYDLRTEFGGKPGESPFEVVMAWKTAAEDRERAALARAEAAEALLRPFAWMAAEFGVARDEDVLRVLHHIAGHRSDMQVADLRRAAAHLATVPQQTSPEASVSGAESKGESEMAQWRPIAEAPRDGTWFVIAREGEPDFYEVGRYDPLLCDEYIEAGEGLYRKVQSEIFEWRGFSNMHRATHFMILETLPLPAQTEARDGG